MSINSFNDFLEHLDIPSSCRLDKPVFKKLFLDNGVLDATDKKCLKDDIARVRWLYTLKPSTINIAAYGDYSREYPEVAILHVELSNPSRVARIARFINRSIPYPLVLLFTTEIEGGASMSISLADKRINQVDKEKWVLGDLVSSGWLNFSDQSAPEKDFLNSLKVTALPFADFWRFYRALMERVIGMNCASYSGAFKLDVHGGSDQGGGRLEKLRELEKLEVQKSELANKLKKEKQMGRQVELNMKIKKLKDRITEITEGL
ncbi:DUF4391 domain-containing protein [Nitrosococcus oceani]|uniref:DUF4391 domain-containing protein n=1 Tax=Nitrosococcus oceani TaxID=1229 RepID=UPI0004E95789|nr:DUF4391 domain-containing protein [Nitrosococcus oceani]KFI21394.1 hypothetical protein HW44_15195 [Nitrosococcus oceani]